MVVSMPMLSGETSSWLTPDRVVITGGPWDLTHAVDPGSLGLGLCGIQLSVMPDGRPWPLLMREGGSLCLECARRVRLVAHASPPPVVRR